MASSLLDAFSWACQAHNGTTKQSPCFQSYLSPLITVVPLPNMAPKISGNPAGEVMVGSEYSFTPSASDADGDTLTFSVQGKPSWASFNPGTGRLFGTPTATDEGTYSNIRISVSDGEDSTTLPAFSITVVPLPNTAPTISGSPASEVAVGVAYSFTPSASDADGDALTFSIQGKPSWASFNSSNGRLSGTPVEADEGTYSNIRISVSDGEESASLPAFSITVVAPVSASANLNWDAPTQNEDGSDLNDLAGFNIYYGTDTDDLSNIAFVNNPSATSYQVDNLNAGTWYFKVTAFDVSGNESRDSGIVSKVIQP